MIILSDEGFKVWLEAWVGIILLVNLLMEYVSNVPKLGAARLQQSLNDSAAFMFGLDYMFVRRELKGFRINYDYFFILF